MAINQVKLFIYLFIINTVQTSIWEYIITDTHKKHTYQYITLVYS